MGGALTAEQREAMTTEARETLLRALERLDVAANAGAHVEGLVVAFAVRGPDLAGEAGPIVSESVGWESMTMPAWQSVGLLRTVLRGIEEG